MGRSRCKQFLTLSALLWQKSVALLSLLETALYFPPCKDATARAQFSRVAQKKHSGVMAERGIHYFTLMRPYVEKHWAKSEGSIVLLAYRVFGVAGIKSSDSAVRQSTLVV